MCNDEALTFVMNVDEIELEFTSELIRVSFCGVVEYSIFVLSKLILVFELLPLPFIVASALFISSYETAFIMNKLLRIILLSQLKKSINCC